MCANLANSDASKLWLARLRRIAELAVAIIPFLLIVLAYAALRSDGWPVWESVPSIVPYLRVNWLWMMAKVTAVVIVNR